MAGTQTSPTDRKSSNSVFSPLFSLFFNKDRPQELKYSPVKMRPSTPDQDGRATPPPTPPDSPTSVVNKEIGYVPTGPNPINPNLNLSQLLTEFDLQHLNNIRQVLNGRNETNAQEILEAVEKIGKRRKPDDYERSDNDWLGCQKKAALTVIETLAPKIEDPIELLKLSALIDKKDPRYQYFRQERGIHRGLNFSKPVYGNTNTFCRIASFLKTSLFEKLLKKYPDFFQKNPSSKLPIVDREQKFNSESLNSRYQSIVNSHETRYFSIFSSNRKFPKIEITVFRPDQSSSSSSFSDYDI